MSTNFPDGITSRGVPAGGNIISLLPTNVLYVDGTNGSDSLAGKGPGAKAKATLEGALAASVASDVIIVAPGTYTLATADLPFTPLANQVWMAGRPALIPNVILTDDAGGSDTDLVDIEVANVTFIGFLFQAAHADVARIMKVADTASVASLNIIDCEFDANSLATIVGLSAIDATYILTGLYCKNTRFRDCNTGISIGAKGFADSLVEDCFFDMIDAAGTDVGIALADTTAAATGYAFRIKGCDFLGPPDAGADAVGITIAGTEDTTAMGMMTDNRFAYCGASAITIDKLSKSEILNYYGDAATGGTLVDPGT